MGFEEGERVLHNNGSGKVLFMGLGSVYIQFDDGHRNWAPASEVRLLPTQGSVHEGSFLLETKETVSRTRDSWGGFFGVEPKVDRIEPEAWTCHKCGHEAW